MLVAVEVQVAALAQSRKVLVAHVRLVVLVAGSAVRPRRAQVSNGQDNFRASLGMRLSIFPGPVRQDRQRRTTRSAWRWTRNTRANWPVSKKSWR